MPQVPVPSDVQIVTLATLRVAARDVLMNATAAQDRVYSPRDWPLAGRTRPCILVRPASNDQETAVGRGQPPGFNATGSIEIIAETDAPALANDAGAENAELAIEALWRQITQTLIGNPAMWAAGVQSFPFIREQYDFSAEGRQHEAAVRGEVGLEYYADPWSFYVGQGVPLAGMDLTLTGYPPAGASIDTSGD